MEVKVQNAFRNDNGEYIVCKVFENHGKQIPIGTVLDVPNEVSQARANELVDAEVVKFTGKKKIEVAEKKPDIEITEDDFNNEKIMKDKKNK
jgi:hypothetical protein